MVSRILLGDLPTTNGTITSQRAPRKGTVRVVLSRQEREILRRIADKLRQSESETTRTAFMDYAKSISLITEKVHTSQLPNDHNTNEKPELSAYGLFVNRRPPVS
jgi:hypothetical protein